MNTIVRDHYPVGNLPADLREGLAPEGRVRITIEADPVMSEAIEPTSLTAQEAIAAIKTYQATRTTSVTQEDAVARIRQLRDEWDDE